MKQTTKKSDTLYYIAKIGKILNLSQNVMSLSAELLIKNSELLKKHKPKVVASAIVYIASALAKERRTAKEISFALGISEKTIRDVGKEVKVV